MRGILLRWGISTVSIMILPYIIPGVYVQNFWAALAAAAVLGIFNATLKPLLIILTLPLTVFTLGFFLLIINGIFINFVGALVSGFDVEGLGSAILASIVVSLVSWFANVSWQKHDGRRVIVIRDDSETGRRTRDLN